MANIKPVNLLTEKETASYLNVTPSWLQKARCYGKPSPKYLKIGGAIRYRRSDIETYLESCAVTMLPTNEEE